MARKKKTPENDGPAGAPEWMVTFSDCMTLLLTFFVLLLSFSSFDEKRLRELRIVFSKEFSVSPEKEKVKEALLNIEPIPYLSDLDKGSEKPTLEKGDEDGLKNESESKDFHNQNVFSISSDKIFLGKGTIISLQGRKILSDMGGFLKEMPNRVVISENPGRNSTGNDHFGLQRAWAVFDYFTTKQHLDQGQFSISSTSLTSQRRFVGDKEKGSVQRGRRSIEIVLLERSIYN